MKLYILKPVFYDDFHCIGDKCPMTCCCGWTITVEKECYDRYREYEEPWKTELENSMKYAQELGTYIINVNERGLCPLLDEKQLCRLVMEKGEEALCSTCRNFPRFHITTGEMKEYYLSLGCPEALHRLNQLEEPLSFVLEEAESSDEPDELTASSQEEAQEIEAIYEAIEADLYIRNCIVDLFQNRAEPIWLREFTAVYCLDKIKELSVGGRGREACERLDGLLSAYFQEGGSTSFRALPSDEQARFILLKQWLITLSPGIMSRSMVDKAESRRRAAELLQRNGQLEYEEYQKAYEEWKEKYSRQFDRLREHMDVYNWMQYGLRSYTKYYMLDNCYTILIEAALIQHLCVLSLSLRGQLSEEEVEWIAVLINRANHGRKLFAEILEDWRKRGQLSPAYLYLLLRY